MIFTSVSGIQFPMEFSVSQFHSECCIWKRNFAFKLPFQSLIFGIPHCFIHSLAVELIFRGVVGNRQSRKNYHLKCWRRHVEYSGIACKTSRACLFTEQNSFAANWNLVLNISTRTLNGEKNEESKAELLLAPQCERLSLSKVRARELYYLIRLNVT